MEKFESIYISKEKKCVLLNGKALENVSELHLDFENGKWSLQVTDSKDYQMQ